MRKELKQTLVLLFLLIGVTVGDNLTFAQNRSPIQQLVKLAQNASGDSFAFQTQTANGAKVYAVRKPSARMLTAIDRGLSDLFAVARKNKYAKHLNYADYTIFIARADRTKNADGSYSPDIAVGAMQYAGTEYDKGGYIYAAGMVVSLNPSGFVIAEHDRQFERVSEVVRYEGEHLVLYYNDRRRFEQTKTHNASNPHPILN